MADDKSAPATKQDIEILMKERGEILDRFDALERKLTSYIDKKHRETVDEMKFYNGKLQRDFVSSMDDQSSQFQDKTDNHEVRITKIEHRLEAAGVGA